MAEMDGKVIAEQARRVRGVIDDATADENEVVVLVAAITITSAIVGHNVGLSSIEPLSDMVAVGREFVNILTDGAIDAMALEGEEEPSPGK